MKYLGQRIVLILPFLLGACAEQPNLDKAIPFGRCKAIYLKDEDGSPITGIEDIAVDKDRALAYLSAYDRRHAQALIDDGKLPDRSGGIYILPLHTDIKSGLSIKSLNIPLRHPHGMTIYKDEDGNRHLWLIDRRYQREEGAVRLRPFLIGGQLDKSGMKFAATSETPLPSHICAPNDLIGSKDGAVLLTSDHKRCSGFGRLMEDSLGLADSFVSRIAGGTYQTIAADIFFANGIALDEAENTLFVAATRGKEILTYKLHERPKFEAVPKSRLPINGAPDGINLYEKDVFHVAAHPNLLRYAAFRSGLLGTDKAPSRVIELRKDGDGHWQTSILFDDPKGALLSGATGVARFSDRLIITSAYDDHIALCVLGDERS